MAKKESFWNRTLFGFLLKQGSLVILAIILLLVTTLFIINIYTNHGKRIEVPNLKTLKTEEALYLLGSRGLKAQIIDSVFVRNSELGTIIEQNPAANSIVKPGRIVYLVVNSKSVRQISFPNMRDISLRQAQAIAKSVGFNVASIQYASSEYRDLVLDVKYNGQSIETGDKIPEGGSIVLIVGDGAGSGYADHEGIPFLIGFDLLTAQDIIMRSGMYLGNINYDTPPADNENSYIVYKQFPEAFEHPGDSIISLYLSKDIGRLRDQEREQQPATNTDSPQPKKEEKKEKVKDIEDFF